MAIRPTFFGFETSKTGLSVNQKALDIVANNTSNIGVTGYTRQRVDLVSVTMNKARTRYASNNIAVQGQGATAYGVSQIRDSFLDKRFREEYSDVGYYAVQSSLLEDISSALDEISPSDMSTAFMNFQAAWTELQKIEGEATSAANAMAYATQLVQIFQQMSSKLDNVWNQQEYNMGLDLHTVNTTLAKIAELNDAIERANATCIDQNNELYQPLELVDQRNVLLDQLSEFADITYREDEKGVVTVFMGGHEAVNGKVYQQLGHYVNDNNSSYKTVTMYWNDTGEQVNFTSGALVANLQMLNGRGVDCTGAVGESVDEGILYYKSKIDQFAMTIAEAFNNVIELENSPGDYKQMFVFDPPSSVSAANIRVNPDWLSDPSYIYTGIQDKLDEGGDSNLYAAKVAQLFKDKLSFGEFNGTISEYISYYSVTKLSANKEYADARLESVSDIADTILNQIQDVSGVSLEEEGVEMMMYQKAYNAMSRIFTAFDDMLDKLINSTGRVGL